MAENNYSVHEAIRDGNGLLARKLIDDNPKVIFVKDEDDRTPLHWAVSLNNQGVVDYIIQPRSGLKQIDIDDMVDSSGWTPLHMAASIGNSTIVQELMSMEEKPDINLTTDQGVTPLSLAVSKNHYDLVKAMIEEYGAKVSIKDNLGRICLHRAASIGLEPIVQLLLDHHVRVNSKDNEGWTSLHYALAEGHPKIAVLLADNGGDITIQNNDGQTPEQVAVDDKVRQFFRANLSDRSK